MASGSIVPLKAKLTSEIATEVNPAKIVSAAVQLRAREKMQIVQGFEASHFELVTSYVWQRTITCLKSQLASLGAEFIGQMLDRPEIDSTAEIHTNVTEAEALSLAEGLGILSSGQAMRLRHSQELIYHFSDSGNPQYSEDEHITREDALQLLRVSTTAILSEDSTALSTDFARFQSQLSSTTFSPSSEDIVRLKQSPYFFIKTALQILVALLKTKNGAPLEHVGRNTSVVLSTLWTDMKQPEKYLVGRAYAELTSDGKKDAAAALRRALEAVKGFDFVPENLRSRAFIEAARDLLEAHRGMNNFYNEPVPMARLKKMGSTIPSPAFPQCMTATLCVYLGNAYGTSDAAVPDATAVLNNVSTERWAYYFSDVLSTDAEILRKLTQPKPLGRWILLLGTERLKDMSTNDRKVQKLLTATYAKRTADVTSAAQALINENFKRQ